MNEHSFIFALQMRVKDENKEYAIRQAALKMIVEEGFKGLSMQKLAKAANVSPGTIYIHFENREDLIAKLYIELVSKMHAGCLKDFDPEFSFKKGLKVLWINRFRYFTENPQDLYFMEHFSSSPHIRCIQEKQANPFSADMRKFVENAIKNNEIDPMPFEVYWPVAFGPLHSMIKFKLEERGPGGKKMNVTEENVLQACDLIIKALSK